MKRYISLILCAFILFVSFSLPIYAVNDDNPEQSNLLEDALSYTCSYDIEAKRVKVSGTMNSEIFRDYSDWTLCVFKLPFGKNESDIISDISAKPIAETMVSIKFDFSFKAEDVADRYSRYAIFLRSPQNEYVLTTEAQYPEVNSTVPIFDTRRYFKGIAGEFSSLSSEIEPGTAILDIDLDSVFSDTSTSLFVFVDNKQYFFNENIISSLDLAVRSMSVSGSRIYFRFLYGEYRSEQSIPDIYDRQVLVKIHSLVVFLVQRYSQYNSGKLSGIILGKEMSYYRQADLVDMTLEEYVDRCVSYTVVAANSARAVDSSIDIVVPLSAEAFLQAPDGNSDKNSFKIFTEIFLQKLDSSFHSGIDLTFLLECSDAPIPRELVNTNANNNVTQEENDILFDAEAQMQFSQYIRSLEHQYRSMPDNYILLWAPSAELSGNVFAATYAYCYYSLLNDSAVSVFAINLADNQIQNNLRNISHVVKYIDTYEGGEVAKNLPSILGAKSWSDLLAENAVSSAAIRHCYSIEAEVDSKQEFLGEFKYFDFTSSGIIENWHAGAGCSSVKSNLSENTDKALKADFNLGGIYDSGEILYVAEYSENMIYTPTLRFKLMVEDENSPNLYEIKIVLGNSENHIESSCIVSSEKISEIYVDISQYISSNVVDYLRISVRSLDGNEEKCSLLLYDICGLSTSYDSDSLSSLIMSERDKIRHSDEIEEGRQYWQQIAIGIGVVLLIGALGVGLFISFRKDDSSDDNTE